MLFHLHSLEPPALSSAGAPIQESDALKRSTLFGTWGQHTIAQGRLRRVTPRNRCQQLVALQWNRLRRLAASPSTPMIASATPPPPAPIAH